MVTVTGEVRHRAGEALTIDSGTHVGVVTNSMAATDVYAVHSGYAAYRGRLVRHGVDLYELRASGGERTAPSFVGTGASLHTKAFVLDGQRGFVGSAGAVDDSSTSTSSSPSTM